MQLQVLQIIGRDTTDIYPLTHLLTEQLDTKLNDLVIKWHNLGWGGKLKIEKYDGSFIQYEGVKFGGTARQVFWGNWMSDYINNESLKILNEIARKAKEANYDIKECVDEAAELLCIMSNRVYSRMADVDSRLIGDGVSRGELRNVSGYKLRFKKYIASHSKILVDQYSTHSTKVEVESRKEDLIDFKPNFYGLGINLNEGWRRVKLFFKREKT